MKILKIFGLVVGIHVIAFMFVFAIPGCRSTRRHSPPRVATEASPAPAPASVSYPDTGSGSPITSSASPSTTNAGSDLNPVTSAAPEAYNGAAMTPPLTVQFSRANPTRPGSPIASNLSTPAAAESTSATTHTVVSGDNLWKVAKKYQITVKELAAANNLRQDAPLKLGQVLQVPGKTIPTATGAPAPNGNAASDTTTYKVRSGDSLALIARRAGTTTAALKSLNKLKSDMVRVGQDLLLPATANAAALVASAPEGDAGATAARATTGTKHVIKPGETLLQIARRYGVSRSELAVANHITNPLSIRPGQELVIPAPKNGRPATSQPAAAPVETAAPTVTPPADSPIVAPAEANPIAPPSNEVTPPVIPVEESNPIAAPKS